MSDDATVQPIPISSNTGPAETGLSLETLTDQNWLFIKHYLTLGDVQKAYSLAGYTGVDQSAPYQVFKRLKPYIEELANLTISSRIKLVADLNQALSLPLHQGITSVSISEFIRLRKLALSLTPEAQHKPALSVLIVNRYQGANGPPQGGKAINPTTDLPVKDVIDIEPIG